MAKSRRQPWPDTTVKQKQKQSKTQIKKATCPPQTIAVVVKNTRPYRATLSYDCTICTRPRQNIFKIDTTTTTTTKVMRRRVTKKVPLPPPPTPSTEQNSYACNSVQASRVGQENHKRQPLPRELPEVGDGVEGAREIALGSSRLLRHTAATLPAGERVIPDASQARKG